MGEKLTLTEIGEEELMGVLYALRSQVGSREAELDGYRDQPAWQLALDESQVYDFGNPFLTNIRDKEARLAGDLTDAQSLLAEFDLSVNYNEVIEED